jgi:hypothetical protein
LSGRTASLALLLLTASTAGASKPVQRTLSGCVVDGTFYSIAGRAYRISTPASLDLRPLEGKGVSMRGWLSPGDRFELAQGARPEVMQRACPTRSLRLVRRDQVMGLRVAATKAATAGEHDRAVELIGQAMALVSPADCDTFTDRAHIMALKGDLPAAAKDVATIKAKKCFVEGRMNPLLLRDLGTLLLSKGDRRAAISALELALAACDGDWCRPDIEKALKSARK